MSLVDTPTPSSGTPRVLPRDAYLASLPRKRVAAGLLIMDARRRVLLVDPVYKEHHDFPGGVVEHNESPRDAAGREVVEELGVVVTPGRLLVADYVRHEPGRTEGLIYLFDGGVMSTEGVARLCPRPGELAGLVFAEESDAVKLLSPLLGRRLRAALQAQVDGCVAYLEDGVPV